MHEILHVISTSAGILLLQDVTDLPNAYESLFCNGEGSQQTCTIEEIQESTERRNFRTDTLQDPVPNIRPPSLRPRSKLAPEPQKTTRTVRVELHLENLIMMSAAQPGSRAQTSGVHRVGAVAATSCGARLLLPQSGSALRLCKGNSAVSRSFDIELTTTRVTEAKRRITTSPIEKLDCSSKKMKTW